METTGHEDLDAIRGLAERFASRELESAAAERDGYPFADFHWPAVEKAGSMGLLGLTLPESHGGSGLGMQALATVLRTLAAKDASLSLLVFSQCIGREFLIRCAPEGMRQGWTRAPQGRPSLLGLPLYFVPEDLPEGVQAVSTDGRVHLSGMLESVACLPVANAALVPADLDGSIRFFLVEMERSGVVVSPPVVSLGLRGCPVADLELRDVDVPTANHLGESGSHIYAWLADRYRGPLSAIALGILDGCCATAVKFARERYQGKKQIVEHDMVRRMLANMRAWIDVGAAAVWRICEISEFPEGTGATEALSLQELLTMAVTRAVTDGVQVLGGYGYMREYGQEKRMRDAKQLQAVFGSSPVRMMEIFEKGVRR